MIECKFCGNKTRNNKYCSTVCYHTHTRETLRGSGNPFFGKKHSSSSLDKMKELKSGINNPMYGKEHSEYTKILQSENNIGKNAGKKPTEETRRKMSLGQSRAIAEGRFNPGSNFGKSGWYISSKTLTNEYYSSSYEKRRMQFLDLQNDVRSWTKKHGIIIPYTLDSKVRSYTPDFLVHLSNGSTVLEEVKGWVRESDKQEFEAKNAAAKSYCKRNDMEFTVIWEDGLELLNEN